MLTTDQRGTIAEAAVILAAAKAGISVLRPLGAQRYDLVFDLGATFLRVQCKSARRRGDVLVVQCHSARRGREGFVKRTYTAAEVDAIAAYSAELDRCYLLPAEMFSGKAYVQLRLEPSRNNQKVGVHPASGFQFESLDWWSTTGP